MVLGYIGLDIQHTACSCVLCYIFLNFSMGQAIELYAQQSPLNPQINAAHPSEGGGEWIVFLLPGENGGVGMKKGLKMCLCTATEGVVCEKIG